MSAAEAAAYPRSLSTSHLYPNEVDDEEDIYLRTTLELLNSRIVAKSKEVVNDVNSLFDQTSSSPSPSPSSSFTSSSSTATTAFVQSQSDAITALLDAYPPPSTTSSATEDADNSNDNSNLDISVLRNWERWFYAIVNKILDLLNTNSKTVLSNTLPFIPLSSTSIKPSSSLSLSTLDFLTMSYTRTLSSLTIQTLTTILTTNKSNMAGSAKCVAKYERERWLVFSRVCRESVDLMGRVIGQLIDGENDDGENDDGSFLTSQLTASLNYAWKASLSSYTTSLSNPLTFYISNEIMFHTYNYDPVTTDTDTDTDTIDHNGVGVSEGENVTARNFESVRVVSGEVGLIFESAQAVAGVLEVILPVLLLSSLSSPSSSSPASATAHYTPSLFFSLISTLSTELSRFSSWLHFIVVSQDGIGIDPVPSISSSISTSSFVIATPTCLASIELVRRKWSHFINLKSSHLLQSKLKHRLEPFEEQSTSRIYQILATCSSRLASDFTSSSLTQLGLTVYPSHDSVLWEHHAEFMGGSRCTYGVSCMLAFWAGLGNDVGLFDDGDSENYGENETCILNNVVFANVLNASLERIKDRYVSGKCSRVMIKQWKVDVLCIVKIASWLAKAVEDRVAGKREKRLLASEIDSLNSISSSLENISRTCCELLFNVAVITGEARYVIELLKGDVAVKPSSAPKSYHRILHSSAVLTTIFDPAKFMVEKEKGGGELKVDLYKLNCTLNGLEKDQYGGYVAFFRRVVEVRLDSREVFRSYPDLGGGGRSDLDLKKMVEKRHELNEWEYPALTEKEVGDKGKLVEVMAAGEKEENGEV